MTPAADPTSIREARGRAVEFYGALEREVRHAATHLSAEGAEGVTAYYHNLLRYADRTAYYRHNWVRRVTPVAQEILRRDGELDILDAGCGRGTESLFFASLGAGVAVTGTDCHWPSLRTARERHAYYERVLGRPLRVSFHNEDVFALPHDRGFDVVWLMESISHIHPAEEFARRLPALLRPGGLVAISDSNRLNPVVLSVMLRLRCRGIRTSTTVLHGTGRSVEMAEERVLTPRFIERRLASLGLRVTRRVLGGFMPPQAGAYASLITRAERLEDLCARTPGLAQLCGIYTVLAEKPSGSSRECAA
jgi:2-polyprenyl-3-methyl-5-hydroxy-6-metoxy-1,4-benzoquinol methylase